VPLIPWPNRLADGRYVFAGEEHQTPLTEPDRRNAIHGLTRWMNWRAVQQDARAVMGCSSRPQPGYLFTLALEIEYALSALTPVAGAGSRYSGEEGTRPACQL